MRTTIVMATYDGMAHLKEQMDSFRLQTRPADEVLIRDDGSTDGTPEFVADYIERYQLGTWTLTCNEHNLGYGKNFVQLLKSSGGDVTFLSDQDDIWDLRKVELMTEQFEKVPGVLLLACDYDELSEGRAAEGLRPYNYETVSQLRKVFGFDSRLVRPGNCQVVSRGLLPLIWEAFEYEEQLSHDLVVECAARLLDGMYIFPRVLNHWRKWQGSTFVKASGLGRERPEAARIYSLNEYAKAWEAVVKVGDRRGLGDTDYARFLRRQAERNRAAAAFLKSGGGAYSDVSGYFCAGQEVDSVGDGDSVLPWNSLSLPPAFSPLTFLLATDVTLVLIIVDDDPQMIFCNSGCSSVDVIGAKVREQGEQEE